MSLKPASINVGECFTIVCHANVSHPSNLTLYWKAPFMTDKHALTLKTSINDTISMKAMAHYNGLKIYCNVSSSDGTILTASELLTVTGMYNL